MKYFYLMILAVLFMSCNEQKDIAIVKGQMVESEIFRTEKLLFASNQPDSIFKALDSLKKTHPSFFNLYFREVFPVSNSINPDTITPALQHYLAFKENRALVDLVIKEFPEDKTLKEALDNALSLYKFYFPNASIPRIYTFISNYNFQAFIFQDENGEDAVAIGLDMFLHPKQRYKMLDPNNPVFSDYITKTWTRDYITRKVLEVCITDKHPQSEQTNLLDYMIYHGKLMHAFSMLLPEQHDTVITEYSAKELKWCEQNEKQMWSFFLEKNLFFKPLDAQSSKYVFQSPDSPGMPPESPGRTGNYIGWKIVDRFMRKNKNITIDSLFKMQDSRMILEQSKYKPAKN
jgi:hypothetical protein